MSKYCRRGLLNTATGTDRLIRWKCTRLSTDSILETIIPSILPVVRLNIGPPLKPLWTLQVVASMQSNDLETTPLLRVGWVDRKSENPTATTGSPMDKRRVLIGVNGRTAKRRDSPTFDRESRGKIRSRGLTRT